MNDYDEEGMADFIGTNTLYVAVLTVCVGILELRSSTADSEWYWIVFVIAVGVIGIRMVRGARRYESSPERTATN
jgi:bacteriorhodopsin